MSSVDTTSPTSANGTYQIQEELATVLTSIRNHLHKNPELGMQEIETGRFIREMLEMHGLAPVGPVGGTGLYVDIVGAHPGPTIAYRADIDALPIPDGKATPYKSQSPGVAHLCGHDAHTSIGIGVALLLHQQRADLHGTARVFFQPNEEGIPSGAPLMIHDGVIDGVDAVYAIHVDPTLDVGVFGLTDSAVTASADRFRVFVKGPSTGHSARPHQSIDTVWVATQILNALYQQVGRVTDARNPAVLTVCRFKAGEAYNVIPDVVEFGGTIRCTDNADRTFLHEMMNRIATHTGAMYGADATVEIDLGSPAVVNTPALAAHVRTTIGALYEDARSAIFEIPRPSMGGEDFAHYLQHIPGILIRVGTASGPATRFPLHDSQFDVDPIALAPAAQLMARVILGHAAQV